MVNELPNIILDEATEIAQVLKLLGDQTRLTMVKLLQHKECCVCELVEIYEMSQPAISQHLRKLKDAGILKETRKGQWVYYALNLQSRHITLIEQTLTFVPAQDREFEALKKKGIVLSCDSLEG